MALVAGATPQSGASTLAINLARIAAAQGARTLLVDAHHAHPALDLAIAPNAPKTLIRLAGLWRPLYRLAPYGQSLSLIPALADEEKLCRSIADEANYHRIEGISGNFDFVVFDGPDISQGSELRALFPAVGKILLVDSRQSGRGEDLDEKLRRLRLPAEKFVGLVRTESDRLMEAA